jgi:hypothetical protein
MSQVCIPRGVNGVMVTSHDTTIRQFEENALVLVSRQDSPIWGLSIMSTTGAFATTNANGALILGSLEYDGIAKKKKIPPEQRIDERLMKMRIGTTDKITKRLCIAVPYLDVEGKNTVEMLDYESLDDSLNVTTKVSSDEKKGKKNITDCFRRYPDASIALHRVRFHPSVNNELRNWTLVGGQAGIVFVYRVPNTYKV